MDTVCQTTRAQLEYIEMACSLPQGGLRGPPHGVACECHQHPRCMHGSVCTHPEHVHRFTSNSDRTGPTNERRRGGIFKRTTSQLAEKHGNTTPVCTFTYAN